METTRLTELKKKYADKTLSRSERQRVLEEIAKEQYKLDPRKTINLHELSKMRLIIGLMSFILCSASLLLDRFNVPDNGPIVIIVVIFALICFALFIRSAIPLITRKSEPSDELSQQNELTASNLAFRTIAAIMILAAFVYSLVGSGSFKVFSADMYWLVCIYVGLHIFIKEAFFLYLDKADADIDEEE